MEPELGPERYIWQMDRIALENVVPAVFAGNGNLVSDVWRQNVTFEKGRTYLVEAASGTGKSTHSSLWLKYIEGTELVNDDNPVVRIIEGVARVYGSPWSGKTPCYRNVVYPVAGIVKLDQAPYNEIKRLKGVKAYAVIVPSISGKRWDRKLAEGLHETENMLAQLVPVWHLDCLPDEAAARLSCQNCAHGA